jgi:hypothetical protein
MQETTMVGNKTHEHQVRQFEQGGQSQDDRPHDTGPAGGEFVPPPSGRAPTNRETRGQNKHNDPGQHGHGPQKHSPAQEKS